MIIKITESEYLKWQDDSVGVCLACGETRYQTEPDAENYECEACGENQVQGCENAMICGNIEIVE